MSIFKACDIRGVYGEDLTETVAHSIGRAIGTLVGGVPVAVGGDFRRSTPALKDALVSGLLTTGSRAVELGQLPTPAFHYALREVVPGCGVMVTASHNPAQYNGVKVVLGAGPPSPEDIAAIESLVTSQQFRSGSGSARGEDVLPRYEDWLAATALRLDGMRVAVDAGGGAMGPVAAGVFQRLGAQVEGIGSVPDPDLAEREPNPALPGALAKLEAVVQARGARLGMGFDGDGDRVIFVDDRARTVTGDLAGTAYLRLAAPREAGARIVYDLKCSSVLPETALALGFVPCMERSGYAFMRRRMLEEDALFGCEMSGHLLFGELAGCDDALYAALGLAGVLAGSQAPPLSQVIDDLPPRVATPDLRVPWPPEGVRDALATLAAAHEGAALSLLDGVRVSFERGWALARPSVTEPLITLRFEAGSEADLAEVIERFLAPVPDLAEAVARLRESGDGARAHGGG